MDAMDVMQNAAILLLAVIGVITNVILWSMQKK